MNPKRRDRGRILSAALRSLARVSRLAFIVFLPLAAFAAVPAAAQTAAKADTQSGVRDMILSPDGSTLATSNNKNIHLWDVSSGVEKRVLRAGDGLVESMVFSPDGRLLVSISSRTAHIWDMAAGQEALIFGRLNWSRAAAFSPDGRLFAIAGRDSIRVWDITTRKQAMSLKDYGAGINTMIFSLDGRMLAAGCEDKTVHLWDLEAQRMKPILRPRSSGF
jgi:WD40 repeat protein